MDEVKGRVLAAWCLDELLGDKSVSERFVYINVVGAAYPFVLFRRQHGRSFLSTDAENPLFLYNTSKQGKRQW